MKKLIILICLVIISCLDFSHAGATPASVPVTSHPRIWLTSSYVIQLRAWAINSNPTYVSMKNLGTTLKNLMDNANHTIPNQDTGSNAWELYPTESVAQFFAFMSLISPTQPERDDYAQRARTLLMYVIDQAVSGVANAPFRRLAFSTSDRSRWNGSGFATTVDWIYPILTATDKGKIRTVFLRWIDENLHASTDYRDHPEPIGVVNDPILLQDLFRYREANNNYFDAHMRNIGLMALSFDAADDSGNTLRNYIGNATGAWLYMSDNLMRNDLAGGLPGEGFLYGPSAAGYISEFMLALHTSGYDDAATWGQQVRFDTNPFWNASIPAFLHSLSPATSIIGDGVGQVYTVASYGDSQRAYNPDWMEYFGPLGIHAYLNSNNQLLDQVRWIQLHTPPGGAVGLQSRINTQDIVPAIFYYMLFSPAVPTPADPRSPLSTTYYASGLRRFFERTDWTPNATWFTYSLGWHTLGHSHADGNAIEFYRNGEWLTKAREGYGWGYASSDHYNTISLLNDQPPYPSNDFRYLLWQSGSQQLMSINDAPPPIYSVQPGYTFIRGDATNTYNMTERQMTDILHASRDIVRLKPDYIVIYDRATSETAGRFKRFFLNLPVVATVAGNLTTSIMSSGQRLYVRTLLPVGATPVVETVPVDSNNLAWNDLMPYRLKVEAPGNPQNTRFLHVLQGANTGTAATAAALVQSNGNTFTGVVVGNTAVMFSTDMTQVFSPIVYLVPNTVTKHLITGLTPGAKYNASIVPISGQLQLTLTTGTTYTADSAGVILIDNTLRMDTIGIYNAGLFTLRNSNTAGTPDITASFGGDPSDLPIAGDWNGDGVDTIGIYRSATGVYFLSDSNTAPAATYSLVFGNPGDTPFAGKWTVDMTHDAVGVYRNSNGILYQKKQLTTGFSDYFAIYGNPGDQGVGGDWDGDGFDSVGIYRSSNQTWFLSNNSTPGGITFSDISFTWDIGTAKAVVGDWNGDQITTVGQFNSAGVFSLHSANATAGSDMTFSFGAAAGYPVAGKWSASALPQPPHTMLSGVLVPNANHGSGNLDQNNGAD